jgi:hypothetical protein
VLYVRRTFTFFRLMTILLYSPALDYHLQKLTELADRVFYIYSEQFAQGRRSCLEPENA